MHLDVVGKSFFLLSIALNKENKLHILADKYFCLNHIVPTAVIWGGPDIKVEKGTMINITCTINYSTEPPAYIFWYHQDEVTIFQAKSSIRFE